MLIKFEQAVGEVIAEIRSDAVPPAKAMVTIAEHKFVVWHVRYEIANPNDVGPDGDGYVCIVSLSFVR